MLQIDFSSLGENEILRLAYEGLEKDGEVWEKQIWQFLLNWYNPEITSIEVFTSGSTGPPKKISHHKQAMLNSAALTCNALNLSKGNNALLCLPVNKIGGMMMVIRSIWCKLNLYCIKPGITPLSNLPEGVSFDFAAFTPSQFHEVIGDYKMFRKADSIKKVLLGGEDVRGDLLYIIGSLSSEVYISFGMTETISHIALKRLNGPEPDTYFRVLPGISISTNEKDCLVINAPSLSQPQLITNDVVRLHSVTEFEWLGRIDNVINSGGVKIHPEEIEQKLLKDIEYPFFIGAVADEQFGNRLAMVLETEAFREKDMEELKELLPHFDKLHRPKMLMLIKQFARTENGKIKRRETLQLPATTISL